jgi:hypothetical protein
MATRKKTGAKSTAVAKRDPKSGAVALPHDYGTDAGAGLDLSIDDLLIPFVKLLQNDSKQCCKGDESHIDGAEAGMIANTATTDLFDAEEGMLVVPSARRRTFVEWQPNQGGFVGEHDPRSVVVLKALASGAKKSELKTEAGNDLQETFSVWGIVLDAERNPVGYCVVPFTSSKIKPYRSYWTQIDAAKVCKGAPIFANVMRITSRFVSDHPSGKKFHNYVVKPADGSVLESMLAPDDPAYVAARDLREAIQQGRAKADQNTAEREGGGGGEGSDEHF